MNTFRLALLAAFVPALLAGAQSQQANSVNGPTHELQQVEGPTPSIPAHSLDAADVTAFFDGFVAMQMERSDIAGASVLVMKDGNVLLEKGYGYADWKTKKPVDPATTIFRLASISKLFTWVSVMQLEEQGKLDLDTDINRYLDFRIRPAFGTPITLRNLMTHTAGFEEVWRNVIVSDPGKRPSLRDSTIEDQPMRMYPPGMIPGYSNYGAGLASYIVQRVSGEPFEQYVQEHIFSPLKMTHSSFYQPLPKELASTYSEGYRYSTEASPIPFELFTPVGAGAVSSTASDMGRFGQALLNGGELDGQRILKPETLQAMWMPQFRASDQLPPIGLGFYEMWRNNLRWIGHGGDTIVFHSLMFVEPTRKLVLFVSYNSQGSEGKARLEVINMFSDRYFPSDRKQSFISVPREEMKSIEGYYLETRRADSTRTSILNPLQNGNHVTVDKDGALSISDRKDLRGHLVKYKPIGRNLWEEVGGQSRLFIIRDHQGRVLRIASDFPGIQIERMPWYEDSTLVEPAAEACIAVLALVMLAPILRIGRRIFLRDRPRPAPQPGTQWLPPLTQLTAWVWAGLFSVVVGFVLQVDDFTMLRSGWAKYFYTLNAVTAIALILSLIVVVSSIQTWKRAELRWITKVKFAMVALSCLLLSWLALHYHVIGPVTRY